MTETKPAQFSDLGIKELRRSAVADFAVDIKPTDNKETVLAALTESGVTWTDYVKQHPEVAPEPEPAPNPGVVTAASINAPEAVVQEPAQPAGRVRVQENPVTNANDTFLVKMTRENPLYETRGYRFTQAHPYALVSAKDAQYILSKEEGFRQAFPDELDEYYG